ncbi:hypothetical protein ARMGADRAFT_861785, partial [Armillaria gallica]
VHPTPDNISSCFRLMELAMAYHGTTLYRYIEHSRCAHKHDDFKFCLSMKWTESDQRYDAWINRRAEWWAK